MEHCTKCGCERPNATRARDKGKMCRPCTDETRKKGRTKYTYNCHECSKEVTVRYKPKPNQICKSCSAKKLAKNMHKANVKKEEEKIRYRHECPICGDVRMLNAKRKTQYCGDCSRTVSKKPKGEAKLRTRQQYFRTCKDCGDVAEVTSKFAAEREYCRPCSAKNSNARRIANTVRPKTYKKRKPKVDAKKKAKQEAIIKKEKERNRKHKEFLATEANRPKKLVVDDENYTELIDEWLKDNKPSVKIKHNEPFPHISGVRVYEELYY